MSTVKSEREAVAQIYRMGNGIGSLVYTDHGAKSDLPHGTKLYLHAESVRTPEAWHEFVAGIAAQKPEKPDYWSSCSQCERNISDAEDLLDAIDANLAQKAHGEAVYTAHPSGDGCIVRNGDDARLSADEILAVMAISERVSVPDINRLQRYYPSMPSHPGWQMSPGSAGEWVLFADVQAILAAAPPQPESRS